MYIFPQLKIYIFAKPLLGGGKSSGGLKEYGKCSSNTVLPANSLYFGEGEVTSAMLMTKCKRRRREIGKQGKNSVIRVSEAPWQEL